jgi:ATP adenylyltransferase
MERIWAPWRIRYIESPKPIGCVLCDKPKEHNDAANYILYRGRYNYIMLNLYPYNPGHLMIAPYRHLDSPDKMETAELHEHFEMLTRCLKVVREVFNSQGTNLGMNLGCVAGAGIDDHIHSHLVPRWNGDTNFMPVLSDVRVIPEALKDTYVKLLGPLQAEFK